MSAWERKLDEYGLKIEEKLTGMLQDEIEGALAYHPFIGELYKDLSEYITRKGKRLASCSTLLTYRGFGKKIDGRILTVCAGIELYRHAILVHDDLVDDDPVRRGGHSIHNKYSQIKDKPYGEGVAVFAGNLLYTLALKAFTSSGFESGRILQAMIVLNDAFRAVNESQLLDLLFGYAKPDVKEWYVMASRRAASLFNASLIIGGLLANAPPRDLQLLREAAEHMGYCFDIQDDIIDTFASEEEYGRKPGGDLLKHKKPLHIVYTYALADKSQLNAFERLVKMDTAESLSKVRAILSNCGALEAAKNRSRQHAESAKNLIAETKMNREVKAFFTDFIDYVKDSLNWYQ